MRGLPRILILLLASSYFVIHASDWTELRKQGAYAHF